VAAEVTEEVPKIEVGTQLVGEIEALVGDLDPEVIRAMAADVGDVQQLVVGESFRHADRVVLE